MSKPIGKEALEYEQYVGGLRARNAELLSACETLAEDCCMALSGQWDRSDDGFTESLSLPEGVIERARPETTSSKTISAPASVPKNRFRLVTLDTTARHLTAAYNAFDSAATKLNCNAVELAESMQDDAIAYMVEALEWYAKNLTDHMDAKALHALSKLKGTTNA